jgi:hypothetical protein
MFKFQSEGDVMQTIETSNSLIPILSNDLVIDVNKDTRYPLFNNKV